MLLHYSYAVMLAAVTGVELDNSEVLKLQATRAPYCLHGAICHGAGLLLSHLLTDVPSLISGNISSPTHHLLLLL